MVTERERRLDTSLTERDKTFRKDLINTLETYAVGGTDIDEIVFWTMVGVKKVYYGIEM